MTKKELKEALVFTGDTKVSHNGMNCIISVEFDPDPVNPREYDSIGKISYHHRKYRLGEEYIEDDEDFLINRLRDIDNTELLVRYEDCFNLTDADYNKLMQEIKKLVLDNFYVYDLYMYEHGNIALSLSPFSCRFDSGQLGYIWESKKAIMKDLGDVTKDKVRKVFSSILEEYTRYINGEVFFCGIMCNDEFIDNTGNLIGEDDVLAFACDILGIQE